MLLDRMEYVTAASDADSIVWICLFTLSSSFMLSDLLLCFESLYYLPSLKKSLSEHITQAGASLLTLKLSRRHFPPRLLTCVRLKCVPIRECGGE